MTSRPTARTLFGRVAVLGVATLASAIVVAPASAIAADDIAPEIPAGEPATQAEMGQTGSSTADDAQSQPESTTDTAPGSQASPKPASLSPQTFGKKSSAEVQPRVEAAPKPVFGFGKQRRYSVNAQVKDGAFAPEGTTTVGSEFQIVTLLQDGTSTTTTCTTVKADQEPQPAPRGYSTCLGVTGGNTPLNLFNAPEDGTMITITQTKAPAGQVLVPADPIVFVPCDAGDAVCDNTIRSADFMEPGSILPITVDDAITVTVGDDPIEVDVLANDTSEDPATALTVTQPPAGQGTVAVVTNDAGTEVLEYTPPATFTGNVPITYTVTNSNGSTDGTLDVTVEAVDVVTPPVDNGNAVADAAEDVPAPVADTATGSLPDAGGPGAELLGAGVLLVAAGGGLTVAARRRRSSGVHAL